jgi:RNA polymerase sigma-70 factor (ECF subfamily)
VETASQADKRDIRAALDGDGAAYGRLVQRYQEAVAGRMRRFTRDPHEHEELVQEVFVQAYFSLKSYKGRAPFLHWLRRIATRTGYRYWKEKSARPARVSLDAADMLALTAPERVSSFEAAETLSKMLALLSPEDRLVLTLHYFEDLDLQEIADQTGWRLTTVKVRAHRARKRLKKALAAHGVDNHD